MSEVLAQLEKKGSAGDIEVSAVPVTSNQKITDCVIGDYYFTTLSSITSLTLTGATKIAEVSVGSYYLECLQATATTITVSRQVMATQAFHISVD